MQKRPSPCQTVGTVAAVGAMAYFSAATLMRLKRGMNLRGKSVLITGGSRGLGLILARQFAHEGARLTLCARNREQLGRAESELRSRGAEVLAVECDVTSRAQVEGLIDGITRHYGTIDVLVNNAGTIEVGPMEEMTIASFEDAMRTHFWAPLFTTLAVLPQMQSRKSGRIVNISSVGGKIAVPHLLPYSASKFALTGFSEGLRSELLKDNIFVTTVCPGLIRTGSARNATFKGQHRKEFAWFVMGDALPITSMSAVRAGKMIVNACREGRGEVVLSVQAKAAVAFHDLFPTLTTDFNSWVNLLLPDPGGVGKIRLRGRDSESRLTRSALTSLDRRAEEANNERP